MKKLQPIVINGQAPPDFSEHPLVTTLLERRRCLSASEIETIALTPAQEGGLGIHDWISAERPLLLPAGRPFDIYSHVQVILRCRALEHALVVGESHSARFGMLAAMAIGLALSAERIGEVLVLDFSLPGAPGHGVLRQVAQEVLSAANISCLFNSDGGGAAASIEKLHGELQRRKGLPAESCALSPSLFLLVADAERLTALHRQPGKLGTMVDSALGTKLRDLYQDGSNLGLHCILTFASCAGLNQILDRQAVERFRHRLVMQCDENESYHLVKSRLASQLKSEGSTAVCALYANPVDGITMRFKPYSTQGGLGDQISEIGRTLKQGRPR